MNEYLFVCAYMNEWMIEWMNKRINETIELMFSHNLFQ